LLTNFFIALISIFPGFVVILITLPKGTSL
jgi:hypothetical protein